ncbi:hypothetical protein ACOME3_010816 [Neoechinorhynchus agilis]
MDSLYYHRVNSVKVGNASQLIRNKIEQCSPYNVDSSFRKQSNVENTNIADTSFGASTPKRPMAPFSSTVNHSSLCEVSSLSGSSGSVMSFDISISKPQPEDQRCIERKILGERNRAIMESPVDSNYHNNSDDFHFKESRLSSIWKEDFCGDKHQDELTRGSTDFDRLGILIGDININSAGMSTLNSYDNTDAWLSSLSIPNQVEYECKIQHNNDGGCQNEKYDNLRPFLKHL